MRNNVGTLVLFCLYTFYYLTLELAINDYAEIVVGGGHVTLLFGISYIVVALGYPLFYFSQKLMRNSLVVRVSFASVAVVEVCSFLTLSLTYSPEIFILCTLLCHLSAGYIGGAVYAFLAQEWGQTKNLGFVIGVAYAAANLIQIGCLVVLVFVSLPVGQLLERIVLMVVLAGITALVVCSPWGLAQKSFSQSVAVSPREQTRSTTAPFKGMPSSAPAPDTKEPALKTSSSILYRYLLGAVLAVAVLALLQGLADGIATSLHAGEADYVVYGYPRLFVIPGLLLAGALADLRDRRFFPFASLIAMVFMSLAIVLFSSPDTYSIATACIYFFASFMTIYSIEPFMRWALATTRPALTSVIGRSVRYAFSGLAIIGGGALFSSLSTTVMLLCYIVLLAGLVAIFFFMGQLRLPQTPSMQGEDEYQRFALKYSLTARETEILTLLTQGLSTTQIADSLFISEKTIRNHISNMLAKTGQAKREELLQLFERMHIEHILR